MLWCWCWCCCFCYCCCAGKRVSPQYPEELGRARRRYEDTYKHFFDEQRAKSCGNYPSATPGSAHNAVVLSDAHSLSFSPPEWYKSRPQPWVVVHAHVIAHCQQSPVTPVEHGIQQRLPVVALHLKGTVKAASGGGNDHTDQAGKSRGRHTRRTRRKCWLLLPIEPCPAIDGYISSSIEALHWVYDHFSVLCSAKTDLKHTTLASSTRRWRQPRSTRNDICSFLFSAKPSQRDFLGHVGTTMGNGTDGILETYTRQRSRQQGCVCREFKHKQLLFDYTPAIRPRIWRVLWRRRRGLVKHTASLRMLSP